MGGRHGWTPVACGIMFGCGGKLMTKARKKLQLRMKRAFKVSVQARKKHKRMVTAYKTLVKKYRAA